MTQEIYAQNLKGLLINKNLLEKELKVIIKNQGKNIFIEGPAENEYIALHIIEALNLGFNIYESLLLKDENIILYILNIRNYTKRKDLYEVKARIIGTYGKTKNNMENLTDCVISIHDNQVGIIGETDCIDEAIIGMKLIIQGSKQGNIYARLEKKKKERRLKPIENIKPEKREKK
jgi:ribosomal RNA assembly protein